MKLSDKHAQHRGLVLASGLLLAMLTGLAQATPVSSWSYSTDLQFSDPSWTAGVAGGRSASPTILTWGSSAGNFLNETKSALTVGTGTTGASRYDGGPVEGSINSTVGGTPSTGLGQIGLGTSLTHWNAPLDAIYSTLGSATITDTLTLTPTSPSYYSASGDVSPATLVFDFFFQETPNSGDSFGLCANGQPASGYAGGCPDLFGFAAVTLNLPFAYIDSGADDILGNADDFTRTYYASIFILDSAGGTFPIQQLTPGECTALDLDPGCFGFRTGEGAQTTARFAFAVTTERIVIGTPEPGSLALLGLALAGLGAAHWRQRRS